MGTVSTNEFRKKLKIMVDGQPYEIIENQFVKPGKGQAFNRVRIKNLVTGRTLERTHRNDLPLQRRFYLVLLGQHHSGNDGNCQGSSQWLRSLAPRRRYCRSDLVEGPENSGYTSDRSYPADIR